MRESRTLGSVRAKAEWLSYSTIPPLLESDLLGTATGLRTSLHLYP